MPYYPTVYDTIARIDPHEWNRFRGDDDDFMMDPRFILAVENSLAERGDFRHVLIRDESETAVACACVCLYRPNLSHVVSGWRSAPVKAGTSVIPRLRRFRLLFCGLPVGSSHNQLRFAPGVAIPEVLARLDATLGELAAKEGASGIAIGEFTESERDRLDVLETMGYRRIENEPTNLAPTGFHDFEDYLSHLRCKKRRHVKNSQKKFARSGLEVLQLRGGDGADELFTNEVYRLYEAVFEHSRQRFLKLPPAFFRELARQLPEQTAFTFIRDGEQVVGFSVAVFSASLYHAMFCGYDYERNARSDLYFNLMFHTVDFGYRLGAKVLDVGPTTDTFKRRRLSCTHQPRYAYLKGTRPIASYLLRARADVLFPPPVKNGASSEHKEPCLT